MSTLDGSWRRQVTDLIALVNASDLTEIEVEQGTFTLRIERDLSGVAISSVTAPAVAPTLADPSSTVVGTVLHSPQVGTFYLSAEPHGDPFLHEGSRVEEGQVIGLIEAMKLINEVEADASGVVRRVLVTDGQPVEYGQALFELDA